MGLSYKGSTNPSQGLNPSSILGKLTLSACIWPCAGVVTARSAKSVSLVRFQLGSLFVFDSLLYSSSKERKFATGPPTVGDSPESLYDVTSNSNSLRASVALRGRVEAIREITRNTKQNRGYETQAERGFKITGNLLD